jgi:hypothetical protein
MGARPLSRVELDHALGSGRYIVISTNKLQIFLRRRCREFW